MNIYCTDKPNDTDLVSALGSLAVVIPIPHGDCVFWGVGDQDTTIRILVERKKIGDMVNSVLNGRYLYQAQLARDAGFEILILIVEGRIRESPEDGLLEIPAWVPLIRRRGWKPCVPSIMYSRFDQYLSELDLFCDIMVKRSYDVAETAAVVRALANLFQGPPSSHQSLHSIYKPPPGQVSLTRPSLLRRVASDLPGIGWERSRLVAAKFQSVREMVNAEAKTWQEIDGIGKKTAQQVTCLLAGGKEPV